MNTPGTLLRSEREKQKKSLNDIEKVLKINIEYLRAIENDNYQQLPADLFAKSYLRSYSKALGLDDTHILDLYNKQFGPSTAKEPEADEHPPRRILPPFKFNYMYLMIICIVIVTVSVAAYTSHLTKKPAASIPVKVNADITGTNNAKSHESAKELLPEKELSLDITATELTWVAIKTDSAGPEERLMRAGETVTLTAHEKFVLKIGNAGGMSLILNGTNIGNLGPHGQVVDIVLP
ncbi:MAG TPA: helix-turn-helix domain-containing protein [Nitrospirae bacterium]|nr:cytoskeletal protein RodZ [bacterium BMS3Bbin09]HDO66664.1 helix-turn-helix domain-containing protein [Nitrospirota bacterium]HDZ83591.1 helix-turn-helix domain-containing protein [Nitrospirota bacterium]HEW80838.1 helix-turn-helix domain-containing protein [Nitrospirota bacterium]